MTWRGFNISIMTVVAIVAVAVAVLVAYSIGRGVSQSNYDDLLDEIDELKAKEKEATIVKRVSQQMEAIAYDQMNLSNKQRDRAEEQSRLAEANAARAEEQSRLAQDNAKKLVLKDGEVKVKGLSTHYKLDEIQKAVDDTTSNKILKAYIEIG